MFERDINSMSMKLFKVIHLLFIDCFICLLNLLFTLGIERVQSPIGTLAQTDFKSKVNLRFITQIYHKYNIYGKIFRDNS